MSQQIATRLSESAIWTLQQRFFEENGVKAWRDGIVPHYITSNPFIAKRYAKLIMAYLQDCVTDQSSTYYIMELGAGCGRFSFHFIKQFFELLDNSNLAQLDVVYIISDVAKANIDFCQNHSAFLPYIEAKRLDFAIVDVEQDQELTLYKSKKQLNAQTLKTPMIVIANYLFDGLRQDVFYFESQHIFECLARVAYPTNKIKSETLFSQEIINKISLEYLRKKAKKNYYQHPVWNTILQSYQDKIDNSVLLFPVGALSCIDNLMTLTKKRLLLLMGDRGSYRYEALLDEQEPQLTLHGSFSLPVNFHIIGQYIEHMKGLMLNCHHGDDELNVSLAILATKQKFIHTRQSFAEEIVSFGPADIFKIKKILEQQMNTLDLQQMLTYLRLSQWDAKIFLLMVPWLHSQLPTCHSQLKLQWRDAIKAVWAMYYHIDAEHEVALQAGLLLASIGYFNDGVKLLREINLNSEAALT